MTIQHAAQLFLAIMVWLILLGLYFVMFTILREEELAQRTGWKPRSLRMMLKARLSRCNCVKQTYLLHITKEHHMTRVRLPRALLLGPKKHGYQLPLMMAPRKAGKTAYPTSPEVLEALRRRALPGEFKLPDLRDRARSDHGDLADPDHRPAPEE